MWHHCDVAGSLKFINAGIWVSCLLFLAVALLAAVLTALFAVVNTTTNPVEPIAGVFGLYVWNSIAGSVNRTTYNPVARRPPYATFPMS
jgi:ABC-type amino acid transport system permease subunit